jgi:hypothetical protein
VTLIFWERSMAKISQPRDYKTFHELNLLSSGKQRFSAGSIICPKFLEILPFYAVKFCILSQLNT